MQTILGGLAFIMSIVWLNIEANEVVSVLETFGLAFNIDTGYYSVIIIINYQGCIQTTKCVDNIVVSYML